MDTSEGTGSSSKALGGEDEEAREVETGAGHQGGRAYRMFGTREEAAGAAYTYRAEMARVQAPQPAAADTMHDWMQREQQRR